MMAAAGRNLPADVLRFLDIGAEEAEEEDE